MIDLYDIGDGRNTQRNVTIERCRARIEALTAQKRDILYNSAARFLRIDAAASK